MHKLKEKKKKDLNVYMLQVLLYKQPNWNKRKP